MSKFNRVGLFWSQDYYIGLGFIENHLHATTLTEIDLFTVWKACENQYSSYYYKEYTTICLNSIKTQMLVITFVPITMWMSVNIRTKKMNIFVYCQRGIFKL